MAKTQDGMDGSLGMSARKGMAMGKIGMSGGDSFGVKGLEDHQGHMEHPDRGMSHNPLEDSGRASGPGVKHSEGMYPAQPSPSHGMMHTGMGRRGK